jgi:hypothetical protein
MKIVGRSGLVRERHGPSHLQPDLPGGRNWRRNSPESEPAITGGPFQRLMFQKSRGLVEEDLDCFLWEAFSTV